MSGRAVGVTAGTPSARIEAGSRTPVAASRWPLLLVGVAVAWNLASLRAETLAVSYLDDGSVHEQMVRFASQQIRAGHLPLTSWFPYLGLGSPQFLHYQSLPAMLTGLIGLAVGADTAFRWSLDLLLAFWPISVYLGARLFGAGRPAAAASAAMSPFLVSVPGIGYEQHAYLWTGYGVWTQLWGSLTLPLAWGFSWRAIHGRREPDLEVGAGALEAQPGHPQLGELPGPAPERRGVSVPAGVPRGVLGPEAAELQQVAGEPALSLGHVNAGERLGCPGRRRPRTPGPAHLPAQHRLHEPVQLLRGPLQLQRNTTRRQPVEDTWISLPDRPDRRGVGT